jgi:transcriptional regulator with XRE-family HTH domain
VNDLLVLLGKRVRELRGAKKWSQEEFAHISGLHRTYIGQIERGEKNVSFGNLSKISGVLGVTLSELLFGLEGGGALKTNLKRTSEPGGQKTIDTALRMREIQKLVRRLGLQRVAMDQTIQELEGLAVHGAPPALSRRRLTSRRPRASKK